MNVVDQASRDYLAVQALNRIIHFGIYATPIFIMLALVLLLVESNSHQIELAIKIKVQEMKQRKSVLAKEEE